MCAPTELYEQAVQVAALAGDAMRVFVTVAVTSHGSHCTVIVSDDAHKSPGDVVGPTVASVSGPRADAVLARLATALRVENPFAAVACATANQRDLLTKLVEHPAIHRAHKTRVLLRCDSYSVAQADAEIENLVRCIDEVGAPGREVSTSLAA